jgi:DHA1 family bicyclomycin/chloramphenicol resistance-like MFS transporter
MSANPAAALVAGPGAPAIAGTSAEPALSAWRMSTIGALLIAVGPISMTLYTPALTSLMSVLDASQEAIRATITVYLMGFAAAQLICGPLSDRFGRRPVLLVSLAFYVIGSTIAALAPGVSLLLLARVIQGAGACSGMALSRVMVVDRFSGNAAARIISLMSLILSVAPTAAPILGGALIAQWSWRVLFVLMALYGALLMALVLALPETNLKRNPRAIELRALVVTYVSLLVSRAFVSRVLLSALGIGGYYTFASLAPFILIGRLGLSSTGFGIATATIMASYFLGSLVTNRLLRRFEMARVIRLGALIVLLASATLGCGFWVWGLGTAALVGPMALWLFGLAFAMPGITSGALSLYPRNAGAAAALMGSLQMGAGFVGATVAALFADAVVAAVIVPPAMGALAAILYLLANRPGRAEAAAV